MNNEVRQLCDEAYFAVQRRIHYSLSGSEADVAYDCVLEKTRQATTATDIVVQQALNHTINLGTDTP